MDSSGSSSHPFCFPESKGNAMCLLPLPSPLLSLHSVEQWGPTFLTGIPQMRPVPSLSAAPIFFLYLICCFTFCSTLHSPCMICCSVFCSLPYLPLCCLTQGQPMTLVASVPQVDQAWCRGWVGTRTVLQLHTCMHPFSPPCSHICDMGSGLIG